MKQIAFFVFLLLTVVNTHAQSHLWVMFTDKGEQVAEQLANPSAYLSPAALQMRAEKGIALSESDLPVLPAYVDALTGAGYAVTGSSRWLNAAVIKAGDVDLASLRQLDFVAGVRPMATFVKHSTQAAAIESPAVPQQDFQYGNAETQINMLNIAPLHQAGITGRGVRIAVLDAGFPGVDTIPAFDSMRAGGRILATYDFVEDTNFVFWANSHGTQVLSTITANQPGQLIGTAPHASVILCRTEDARSETEIEERYFMQAVEFADSVGVDVLHASLGYTKFDNDINSHTYEDLNGDKAIATRAVDMAAQRGIIVTISAGNEGASRWRHISVPCDADSALCVGAVDRNEELSYFSSVGPTADDRIKPDVVAMGTATAVANPRGRIVRSNGTSFSGPLMAGVMACLRQAHPDRSNMDLIQAIRLSGDQSQFPDNEYGYGVPDVVLADSLLDNFSDLGEVQIAMAEKPQRGKVVIEDAPDMTREEAPKKEVVFTSDPKTVIKQKRKKISLSTEVADAVIREVKVFRGEQAVDVDPADIKESPYEMTIKTKWFLPGDYYLHIQAGDLEEFIPFTIE